MVRKVWFILAAALCISCGKLEIKNMLFPYAEDVNTRVAESLGWNDKAGVTTLTVPEDDYRFYACTDIHIEDSRPENFAAMVQKEKADEKSAFYLVLGDLLFGKEHMEWVDETMSAVGNDPGFVIAGNHDIFYGGWSQWLDLFHSSTYYFFVQTPSANDIYIMLDSANGTLGEKQLAWLEGVFATRRPGCRHCIVGVHTNMFRTDASQLPSTNFTLEETYRLTALFSKNNVDTVLSGHDHFRDVSVYNGVTYITLDQIKDGTSNASYMIFDMGQCVDYQFVSCK
ncbi:MAG: metallophosphoesterase [Bacteroidales bacterium]|nr:metallophosphoesterase [Bacteroidales bacterium]